MNPDIKAVKQLKLFDTHAHYDDRAYSGCSDAVIKRVLTQETQAVAGFIQIGCSIRSIPKSLEIAEKYDGVYAAVGIQPGYVNDTPADYLSVLRKFAANKKVVALGEMGLDYHYNGYIREKQIKFFKEQLSLARELDLPTIIHSRDATEDTMEILRESKPRAVMHCYSGSAETANELVKLGMLISFTGVITFKNAKKAVETCKSVPLENIMLETDCPYMAPEPYRGKLCDSSMAWQTAEKIAEIKGVSVEYVVEICNNNAKNFFGIDF